MKGKKKHAKFSSNFTSSLFFFIHSGLLFKNHQAGINHFWGTPFKITIQPVSGVESKVILLF
jgi:hypothetical protein